MKVFLFKSIAAISASIISFNMMIGNAITGLIAALFNGINAMVNGIGTFLMSAVDKDRYEHAKLATQQYSQLAELDLLIAVTKVKEDAIKSKMWTVGHTIAMNKIGSALYAQHRWEPTRVHKYLKSVIEDIPGMVYQAGDDFGD